MSYKILDPAESGHFECVLFYVGIRKISSPCGFQYIHIHCILISHQNLQRLGSIEDIKFTQNKVKKKQQNSSLHSTQKKTETP